MKSKTQSASHPVEEKEIVAQPLEDRGLTRIKRQTLRERIYVEVRRALQAGQFEPGESITVKFLEDALGAGAMPVRESLQRLVAEGALVNLPNGRVRVPFFTASEFDEIKEIRLRLEGYAAKRAASERTAADLDHILENYSELTNLIRSKPAWPEIIQSNYSFHFSIYRASHTSHLVSMIDSLWLRVSPLLSIPFKTPDSARADYVAVHEQNHADIVKAIQDQDGRAAEAAIREIILASAGWYHRYHRFAPAPGQSADS